MFDSITLIDFLWLVLASAGIGLSKSGFPGVSMVHVVVFAFVFGAKDSTGVLLPLLVVADVLAVVFFGGDVQWKQIKSLMPPAMIGVVIGFLMMEWMKDSWFQPLVGGIIFALTLVQCWRMLRPNAAEGVPHEKWFAIALGLLAGVTTMVANAAGPIIALYLLAVALPKFELVGTGAWFFLIINIYKLPFSWGLGLISFHSLGINLILAPAIPLGVLLGKWMLHHVPQREFNLLMLLFTGGIALKLVFGG